MRIERESAERRAVQVLRERDWDARVAQRKTEDDEKESRRIAEETADEEKRLREQAVTQLAWAEKRRVDDEKRKRIEGAAQTAKAATATFEPMLTFGDLYTG